MQTSDFSHDDYAASVVDCLNEAFPNASCTLDIETPFRLCIRAIMSAQCTDKKVNIVSKELFKKYPTPNSMDTASEQDIAQIIKPCGMHAKKSYYIKSFSILFENEWAKEVPRDVDILMKCPGIGRKIANLMVGEIYGIPAIVVDTHCKRVAGRMGLSSSKNPAGIEKDLCVKLNKKEWIGFGHRAVLLGRSYCKAIKPQCETCPATKICTTIID